MMGMLGINKLWKSIIIYRGSKMLTKWIHCPICDKKTRIMVRKDTEVVNFPLYCPKCKQETLVNIKQFHVYIVKEPDAKTQSQ